MDQDKRDRLMRLEAEGCVREIPSNEAATLEQVLRANLTKSTERPETTAELLRRSATRLTGMSGLDPSFRLAVAFEVAAVREPNDVLLNFGNFHGLDEVPFRFLNAHFREFWYPIADDMDILDRTMGWAISIDYDGALWVWSAQRRVTRVGAP